MLPRAPAIGQSINKLSKALAVDQEHCLVALWGKTKRTRLEFSGGYLGLLYYSIVYTCLYQIYR